MIDELSYLDYYSSGFKLVGLSYSEKDSIKRKLNTEIRRSNDRLNGTKNITSSFFRSQEGDNHEYAIVKDNKGLRLHEGKKIRRR